METGCIQSALESRLAPPPCPSIQHLCMFTGAYSMSQYVISMHSVDREPRRDGAAWCRSWVRIFSHGPNLIIAQAHTSINSTLAGRPQQWDGCQLELPTESPCACMVPCNPIYDIMCCRRRLGRVTCDGGNGILPLQRPDAKFSW